MPKESIDNDSRLKIVRIGHPALREKSARVTQSELKTIAFQKFLDDLVNICDKHSGVGIAAPQVAVNKRAIVVHVDPSNPRYKNKKNVSVNGHNQSKSSF